MSASTERSRRLRQDRRNRGLVARTHWIHPGDAEALRNFVDHLSQRRRLRDERTASLATDGRSEHGQCNKGAGRAEDHDDGSQPR